MSETPDTPLATLLWDSWTEADCWTDMPGGGGSQFDNVKLAAWLAARGVIVLPSEPSEAMIKAAEKIHDHHVAEYLNEGETTENPMRAALRAALAVLRDHKETP